MFTSQAAPGDTAGPSTEAAGAAENGAKGADLGAWWRALTGIELPLAVLAEAQADYLRDAAALWNGALARSCDVRRPAPPASPPACIGDRRFAASEWAASPMAAFVADLYLLNARTLMRLAEGVKADPKTQRRLRFAVQQWIDAASPSNWLAFNPEAQAKALRTHGASLSHGMRQLWGDLRRGHLSLSDETAFEVGRNLAVTEGSVVFENPLFQLIEYRPLTAEVHARPLLVVPPCINKFYILDLQPRNSFVRHAVAAGHRVFLVSWRNPDASFAHATWDDYVGDGLLRAIEVVREIAPGPDPERRINMLGFCIGGTLLSTALAVLAARGEQPAASLTLLTTFLDFADTGVMDLFIDEATVRWRERTIGGGGLLDGRQLAATFSLLRPNDLVWNYVVGNYLKGESPPPFDLLYWNADATNLSGPMYAWYLRNAYLENNFIVPGKVRVCGEPVDLGRIAAPAYIYASREDHIVPWQSAWRSTQVLGGPSRFVLGASGHIAGVINPPDPGRRSYWTAPEPLKSPKGRRRKAAAEPQDAEAWFGQAVEQPGSWWGDWSAWLDGHGGGRVPAPGAPGSAEHPPIEPAPGRYVTARV